MRPIYALSQQAKFAHWEGFREGGCTNERLTARAAGPHPGVRRWPLDATSSYKFHQAGQMGRFFMVNSVVPGFLSMGALLP